MKMIRRQSLRPRQIDIYGKMLIIRSVDELDVFEDESGVGQKVTSLEDLNSLIDEQPPKPRKKKNIPIPIIKTVPNYEKDVPADFEVPTSYVRFQNLPQEGDDLKIEVDLQIKDMEWLKDHPKYGENGDPRYQLSLETFNKMIDILEKASGPIYPNLVTQNEAEELFTTKMQMSKTSYNRVTLDVYNYWVQRRNRTKKPLLRRYWPKTPLNDTNPHLVFRPREKERYKLRKHRKNDMEGFRKLQQLRDDFDRARTMLKLVRRRERYKRMLVDVLDEMRRQTMHELTDRSGRVRKPKIPTEEDRDIKRKKKKKKLKRLRKESTDSTATLSGGDNRSGNNLNGLSDNKSAFIAVPTFLDRDMSTYGAGFSEPPEFTSYCDDAHFQPTAKPRKYQCRGRLGRGGRILIDRVPIDLNRSAYPIEECVNNFKSRSHLARRKADVADADEPPSTESLSLPKPLSSEGLYDICKMSDSEDELMDPSAIASLLDTSKPRIDHSRPVKYKLQV